MPLSNISALIVDDEADWRILGKSALKAAGVSQILVAGSASEAFDILTVRAAAGHQVDLLLVDLTMPLIDGREFLKEVCTRHELRPAKKILLTNMPDIDRGKAKPSRYFDGRLEKPLKPQDIVALVSELRAATAS